MNKKILTLILAFVTMSIYAQKVTFVSEEFEAGVKAHLGFGETDDVLQTQTDTITAIDMSGLGIVDISDVAFLPNVTWIDLGGNMIEDVSPLASLEHIHYVNLKGNALETINPLVFACTDKLHVNVAENYIKDYSYFFSADACQLILEGMGAQKKEKNAFYFNVYQLYADINETETQEICYRGFTNMESDITLACGSLSVPAIMDGYTNNVSLPNELETTTLVTISNGEVSEETYVVPAVNFQVEPGQSFILETGLPEDYEISYALAAAGKVEIVGNAMQYTAPDYATPDVIYFCYYKNYSLKGYSRFYINRGEVASESIKISSAKQVTYMSDKNLNFTDYPDLKAYVATGYDKASGTIWLTRVKEVPANTGFLLMGEADTYEIPVKTGGSNSYYQNMFKGTIEGTTIQTTDGDYTNYYLSNGDAGVGFYKVQGSVELKPNRAYLSVPTEIPAVGATGSTETIKVSAAGQVPYYNSQSLDFTSMEAQGVKAYTATGYDYTSGTIWLTRVKQVPAETGILIMAPQGEYPVPTASVASVYANMFKGTLTGTTIQTHETIAGEYYINYYLSSGDAGVGFYKVTKEGGVTIGANRCYLPIKNKDAAGTRSAGSGKNQIAFEEADEVICIQLMRGIGGDEDGTTNLTPALSKGEGEWFTLQGQRVAKPSKGLYIRNGKKVVIK